MAKRKLSPEEAALECYTTDQLLDEIAQRFDTVVFAAQQNRGARTMTKRSVGGNRETALGMIEVLKTVTMELCLKELNDAAIQRGGED